MQGGQRLSDGRVSQSREPAGLGGRKRLDILADGLDKQQFRQTRQDVLATRARSGPPPPSSYMIGSGVGGRANADISGAARIPGALDKTCASPWGNTMRSPSCRSIGSSPTTCPQHVPRASR